MPLGKHNIKQSLAFRLLFILFFTILCFLQFKSHAQIRITCTVTDTFNTPLTTATVTILNKEELVIAYSVVATNGVYNILLPNTTVAHNLTIEVSHIGFNTTRVPFNTLVNSYKIALVPTQTTLKTVIIKNRPFIKILGDTLRYKVSAFETKEDRSIGDVIRRLPGVEVATDGTIYFNGKQVENLYIHGDDLMDGRYGLATKVIKKEMIESIDIILNHQPIKVLENKIFSDKTSVNLVLKNENSLKIATDLNAGIGFPSVYSTEASAILLSKKIKAINFFGINNIGKDYGSDMKQLGNANFISNLIPNADEVSLSLATITPSGLPLYSYFFNNSATFNANNLYNLKNGLQVKLNLQAFNDKGNTAFESTTINYLATDTIIYTEKQFSNTRPKGYVSSLNFMLNRNKYFFNNNTKFIVGKDGSFNTIKFNQQAFNQTLNKQKIELINDFNFMPLLSKTGVGEMRWLIDYNTNNQALQIGNGFFTDVKNHKGFYDLVEQEVAEPKIFSHLYFSYKSLKGKISKAFKVGNIWEKQTVKSQLKFDSLGTKISYTGDFGNNLRWQKFNTYVEGNFGFKTKKINIALVLPIGFQAITITQKAYSISNTTRPILINPYLSFKYNFNSEDYLVLSNSLSNSIGTISGAYKGAILLNYRFFNSNEEGLQELNSNSTELRYNLQRSIKLFFSNFGIRYKTITANSIISDSFTNNIRNSILLPFTNKQTSASAFFSASKFSFILKSTFAVKANFEVRKYNQFINNSKLPFTSNAFNLEGSILKKISGIISINYTNRSSWFYNRIDKNNSGTYFKSLGNYQMNQQLKLSFTPYKKVFVEIEGMNNLIKNDESGANFLFVDANIKYDRIFKRFDVGINLTNLLNTKKFSLYSFNSNQFFENNFSLRGRMALFSTHYYF